MDSPPDTIGDEALIIGFLQDYAAGKHMAAYYIKIDKMLEACQRYQPEPPPTPSQGDVEWLEDLDEADAS